MVFWVLEPWPCVASFEFYVLVWEQNVQIMARMIGLELRSLLWARVQFCSTVNGFRPFNCILLMIEIFSV